MVEFKELEGDDLGVYHDKNYRVVECLEGHIVFSYAQKGKAMTIHFASDKVGLRRAREALNDFCDWIFNIYDWCKMIFAGITLPSIMRLAMRCGFNYVAEDDKHTQIYARVK